MKRISEEKMISFTEEEVRRIEDALDTSLDMILYYMEEPADKEIEELVENALALVQQKLQ